MGFFHWLSRRKLRKYGKPASRDKADASLQVPPSGQIATPEQARATYDQANVLYERGDFSGAIVLYDYLLDAPPGLVNSYEVRKIRAMAYCKVGRFPEAEQELKQLLDILRHHGAPVANSQVMYWYLVARCKGDEKKAMDKFLKL